MSNTAAITSSPTCDQRPSLHQPCFHERPIIDRLEALFHPEMLQKFGGWDHTTMRDFEARLPRHQLDPCEPYRANQHQTLLGPCEAHGTAEAEQPRINDGRAHFLHDFSAQSLLPGLITFGTATWPAPSLAIVADQHDAIVASHAESIRSVGSTLRSCSRRVPGDQPIAPIRANCERFAV